LIYEGPEELQAELEKVAEDKYLTIRMPNDLRVPDKQSFAALSGACLGEDRTRERREYPPDVSDRQRSSVIAENIAVQKTVASCRLIAGSGRDKIVEALRC
jgi:hypothetical protein